MLDSPSILPRTSPLPRLRHLGERSELDRSGILVWPGESGQPHRGGQSVSLSALPEHEGRANACSPRQAGSDGPARIPVSAAIPPESVPRALFFDHRLTPLGTQRLAGISGCCSTTRITGLSTFNEQTSALPASTPCAPRPPTKDTGANVRGTLLRLTRWLSLCAASGAIAHRALQGKPVRAAR